MRFYISLVTCLWLASSCATKEQNAAPPSTPEGDLQLDPNAPAIPPESAAPEKIETPQAAEPPAAAAPVEAMSAPVATEPPPAQDPGNIGTLDDDHVPTKKRRHSSSHATSAPVATNNQVLGSGKQVRFIKAAELHIREKPDRFSKSLGIIHGGDEVHVTIRGDWAKLEEGQWIRSRWLVKVKPKAFAVDSSTDTPTQKAKAPRKSKKHKKK